MIREGNQSDLHKLVIMWRSLDDHVSNVANNDILKQRTDNYLNEIQKTLADIIKRHNATVFVAENNQEIVGFCTAHVEEAPWFSATTGLIGSCWVEKEFRNRNIGSQLLARSEKWLQKKEAFNIQVCWDKENAKANSFWLAKGYNISQLRRTKKYDDEIKSNK